jgi:hypothetical protein
LLSAHKITRRLLGSVVSFAITGREQEKNLRASASSEHSVMLDQQATQTNKRWDEAADIFDRLARNSV